MPLNRPSPCCPDDKRRRVTGTLSSRSRTGPPGLSEALRNSQEWLACPLVRRAPLLKRKCASSEEQPATGTPLGHSAVRDRNSLRVGHSENRSSAQTPERA